MDSPLHWECSAKVLSLPLFLYICASMETFLGFFLKVVLSKKQNTIAQLLFDGGFCICFAFFVENGIRIQAAETLSQNFFVATVSHCHLKC